MFAEAAPGWEQALSRLKLDALDIGSPPGKESSPFGRALLALVVQNGIEVEAYCRTLADRLDQAHRKRQGLGLIAWQCAVESVLASLPEATILRLHDCWVALLGHPFQPTRRFAVEMITKETPSAWPSLRAVVDRLHLQEGDDEYNTVEPLLKLAKQDPAAIATLSELLRHPDAARRNLAVALISGLGAQALPLLDELESRWRAEPDLVKAAHNLATLASAAPGADPRKKQEIFEAIEQTLRVPDWRGHSSCYRALGRLQHQPATSVEILARALDTEELAYDGLPHLAIVEALEAFGLHAAPHAAAVARHLADCEWEVNNIGEAAILRALEAMGTGARAAAPHVRAWLEAHPDDWEASRKPDAAPWLNIYRRAQRLLDAWS